MVNLTVTYNIRENVRKFANTKHFNNCLGIDVNGISCNKIVVKQKLFM